MIAYSIAAPCSRTAALPLQILVALGAATLLIGMLRLHYQAARFVTRGLGYDGELSAPSLSVAGWFIPGANLVLPMISLLAAWQVVASVAHDAVRLRRPPVARTTHTFDAQP